MNRSFTIFLAIFPFLLYATSAISTTLSPSFASNQIRFWSENVQNKMPTPILKKLSPLTQNDSDYYANMISNNVKFSADSSFCSLAKLSCGSAPTVLQGSTLRVQKNEHPSSYFRLSILKNGNLVHLPNLEKSLPDRAFLPHQIASRISLNIKEISKLFSGSVINEATKKNIENTLSYCNAPAIKGEVKSCPKSLEEMINFSKSTLGGEKLISITPNSTQGSNSKLTIKKIEKFNHHSIVACHEAFLPFAVYFCHSLSSTSLYSVDLVEPKTGAPVNTLIAICHMDTTPWPENHVAFKILKLKPGQGEACHWYTQIDLAWLHHKHKESM